MKVTLKVHLKLFTIHLYIFLTFQMIRQCKKKIHLKKCIIKLLELWVWIIHFRISESIFYISKNVIAIKHYIKFSDNFLHDVTEKSLTEYKSIFEYEYMQLVLVCLILSIMINVQVFPHIPYKNWAWKKLNPTPFHSGSPEQMTSDLFSPRKSFFNLVL